MENKNQSGDGIMTVTIPSNPDGTGTVTVNISKFCPTCGRVRGVPQTLEQNYTINVWNNPCGHTDFFPAVRKEARENGLNTNLIPFTETPLLSYSTKYGKMMSDGNEVRLPARCIILGYREFYSISNEDSQTTVVYSPNTSRSDMIAGNVSLVVQAVLMLDGVVYRFSTRTYAGTSFFHNKSNDRRLDDGILDRIKNLGIAHKRYFCFDISVGEDAVTTLGGKSSVSVYPLRAHNINTYGNVLAGLVDGLYLEYNIQDWETEYDSGGD